jgi:hypothetical protein
MLDHGELGAAQRKDSTAATPNTIKQRRTDAGTGASTLGLGAELLLTQRNNCRVRG